MTLVTIRRFITSDQGTFGVLIIDGFQCYTLELPWRDNRSNVSCIPAGTYDVEPWNSQRFPGTYHVRNVDGRSAILTHIGNLGGDKLKGFRTHTAGCILVGLKLGALYGQKAILMSSVAMDRLRDVAGRKGFQLDIKER